MDIAEGLNQLKIDPKGLKFIEMGEKGEEDRISGLPDCMLIEILSRLDSTEEAIRTSTLSKRWKYVWTWLTTLTFIHSDYDPTECRENPKSRSDFISFVDQTLTQSRQSKLKKFEARTKYHFPSFDIRFKSQFNNWIRYAVSCKVEKLNLSFYCWERPEFPLDQFLFINSCFTHLTVEACILNPTGAISWKNLRKLCMCFMKTEEDLIENILSGSPLLETLVLECCYGYKLLNITSKSVKKLVFSGYDELEDQLYHEEIIKINAPNISSLTIEGELLLWKVVLLNVSSLVEAELDYEKQGHYVKNLKEAREEMLKGFILKLLHVKELKIGSCCSPALSRLEAKGFVLPSNIKFPDVTFDCSETESDTESEIESESVSESDSNSDSVENRDWGCFESMFRLLF